MDEEERRLLEGFRQLSPSNKHIALAQIIAGAEFEASARRLGREAMNGPAPVYANRDPVPMGEVVNG